MPILKYYSGIFVAALRESIKPSVREVAAQPRDILKCERAVPAAVLWSVIRCSVN
jgi:hypothetical protein